MDLKTLYSLKVFEKLGEPLISAVARARHESGADDTAQDVQKLSELLNVSVKLANALAAKFDIKTPEDGDAIRLTLASVVSDFVAENYAAKGNILDEGEIKSHANQLETLLGFVNHYQLAEDAANRRLRLVDNDPLAVTGQTLYDSEQIALKSMQALMPIAQVVAGFSFGKDPNDYAAEISKNLSIKAAQIRGQLYPHLEDKSDQNLAELGILRSLSSLYAKLHAQKQVELEALTTEKRSEIMINSEDLIKDLWEEMDLRIGILVGLTQGVIGQTSMSTSNQEIKAEAEPDEPKQELVAEEPQPEKQAEEETEEAPANPMSFFKKGTKKKPIKGEKDDDDDDDGNGGRRGGGGKGFKAHKMKMGGMGGM